MCITFLLLDKIENHSDVSELCEINTCESYEKQSCNQLIASERVSETITIAIKCVVNKFPMNGKFLLC